MKERELREASTCLFCKRKIGACGSLFFYRLSIERFGVKMDAVKRQSGIEMMLGGHVRIAQAMGADEDMAVPVMEKAMVTICDECSTSQSMYMAQLAEMADKEEATT